MQDSGRDSKPGVGAKNLTAVQIAYGEDLLVPGVTSVIIDLAQVEHGVYRAILDDLFTTA